MSAVCASVDDAAPTETVNGTSLSSCVTLAAATSIRTRARPRLGAPRASASRHHDGELLTADARDDVAGPDDARELAGDLAQHGIAGCMPVGVVRALEVVDVEEQQPECLARARGLERGLELFGEVAAVREARQGIRATREVSFLARLLGEREGLLEPLLRALAVRDVLHDAVDDQRAVGAAAARAHAFPDPADRAVAPDQPVLQVDSLEREDARLDRVVPLAVVGMHRVVPDLLRILPRLDLADEAPPVLADPRRMPDAVDAQLVRVEELVDRADDTPHLVVQDGELGIRAASLLERLAELTLRLLAGGHVGHRAVHEQPTVGRALGPLRTQTQRSHPSRSRTRCS